MFIPVRTDRRITRTPWVNYTLIGINIVVYLLTWREVALFATDQAQAVARAYGLDYVISELPTIGYYLWPDKPRLYQFITYQFLHQDWMHLAGNMLFLWVFGNSVEDRLGKVGYLIFYLAGGVLAGVAHAIPPNAMPVLGASGSVAAVTGAYLALFPLSDVTLVFIFGGAFEVSSMVLILFRIAQDVLFQVTGIGGVAYMAHLMGYAVGFGACMLMLISRLLPREPYDMLALLEHRRRRAQFRKMAKGGYYAWDVAKPSDPVKGEAAPLSPQQQALMEKRAAITRALAEHRGAEAARLYGELLQDDPRQVMNQQQQLDLANQLMSEGAYDRAARAYELMLATYPGYAERPQVSLILGLIYARYLDQKGRARELLKEALPSLRDGDRDLAQRVLAEIG